MENSTFRSNPFFILHASLTETRKGLQDKASEVILLEGSEDAGKALAELLHPQKRLSAELGWFPNTEPAEIEKILSYNNGDILPDFQTGSDLAMLNGCRYLLYGWPAEYAEGLTALGLCLAGALLPLSGEQVREELNQARMVSGFPEILDNEAIADQLQSLCDESLALFSKRQAEAKNGEAAKAASLLADAYCGNDPLYTRNYYLQKMVESCMLIVSDQETQLVDTILGNARQFILPPSQIIEPLTEWDKLTTPRRKIRKCQGLTDEASGRLLPALNDYLNSNLKKRNVREAILLLKAMLDLLWDLPDEKLAQHRAIYGRLPR